MNRPTELTIAYATNIWDEGGNGLDELSRLKETVVGWLESDASEMSSWSAIFFEGVGKYALASVDWRLVEAEVEKYVSTREKDS